MPLDLPGEINQQKNKLDAGTWLYRLKITVKESGEIVNITNNNEDLTIGGTKYTRSAFTLSPWESKAGELPHRTLSITNVDYARYLWPYIKQYKGLVDSEVIVTPVNNENKEADMSAKSQKFQIMQTIPASQWIQVTLGYPNPMMHRFPPHRYLPGTKCRWYQVFSLTECGYTGEGVCNGTYESCEALGNQARFGAELGLRPKTSKFVYG